MSSVMVTGGLGFVGRHLVGQLAEGGAKVVAYNRDYATGELPNVEMVQGELFDLPRLLRTLEEHGVKQVLHTAAMSHPDLSVDLPLTTFAANVTGTLSVLEAARMTGVQRVVNFSSESAYGHQEVEVVHEDARLRPTTPYGVSKVTTELLGDVYTDLYGVEVISLRITEVYGPGNPMPEVLREMLASVVAGQPFRLETGGDSRYQFIHVEDVARAAIAAAHTAAPTQRVYNITGGRQVTLTEVAQLVRKIVAGAQIEIGSGPIASLDRHGPFDISAADRDLGYRPQRQLEDGLREYAAWLADHRF